LKQYGFTIAISPHKSLKTALLLALAGIPCRIGFRQSGGWFLYHHRVQRVPALHDVERNLSILQAFGIGWTECQQDLHIAVRPELRQSVEGALRSYGVRGEKGKLRIGLSPGSVWPMKRWSVESYADLILALRQGYACEFLLFGAGEDERTVAKLQQLTGGCGINLVGRFTLRELPAAIETCDLFICNDTGPMHIAVACGIPVVAIFCATTPSLGFYPYSNRAVVVEKELHCRPCSSHGGLRCPLGTEDCIALVRPEHVLEAVRGILDARGGDRARGGSPYRPRLMTL
jgi:heptosyltransferase-2